MYDFGRIGSTRDDKTRNACTTSGEYGWHATIKPNTKENISDYGS